VAGDASLLNGLGRIPPGPTLLALALLQQQRQRAARRVVYLWYGLSRRQVSTFMPVSQVSRQFILQPVKVLMVRLQTSLPADAVAVAVRTASICNPPLL
jgi:hypothetical protein